MILTDVNGLDWRKKFTNRKDAGTKLSRILENYVNRDALVLGIPRGGVEVAFYVSRMIKGELSVIGSKKLPFPDNEELSFGAIAEDGSFFLTAIAERLQQEDIGSIIDYQLEEVRAKALEYRRGDPLPDMHNRTVIIVDDGISTGSTIVPALELCKARGAGKLVVAAPVSANNYVPKITALADDVRILEQPDDFFAVSDVYDDFAKLSDEDVTGFLDDFKRTRVTSQAGVANFIKRAWN